MVAFDFAYYETVVSYGRFAGMIELSATTRMSYGLLAMSSGISALASGTLVITSERTVDSLLSVRRYNAARTNKSNEVSVPRRSSGTSTGDGNGSGSRS